MPRDHATITSIDIGFDLRAHSMLTTLISLPVYYLDGKGVGAVERLSHQEPVSAAEQLARAGYSVIVFKTDSCRDVQCSPRHLAPTGEEPGYTWTGIAWAVQAKHDNYWCVGPSLHSALERAGWTEREIHPCTEQEDCS